MTKRIDAPDTVEAVVRLLTGLQVEGWGAKHITYEVDYAAPSPKHRKVPVGATVTVRLVPSL